MQDKVAQFVGKIETRMLSAFQRVEHDERYPVVPEREGVYVVRELGDGKYPDAPGFE
jgi:hypothetical protein